MARRPYTAEEIFDKLREAIVALAEGEKVTAEVRNVWVSEQTYGLWDQKTSIAHDLACRPAGRISGNRKGGSDAHAGTAFLRIQRCATRWR